ncbi:unnamed protein product [Prorocentrum cordatum]|uniref:Uncharacterized protein n=1 Tax=Prorocentrum cordatum TaxID=2364126 RepID=A0ABN9RQQ1_9DINO|nr:unnamed protein product [Polarella glacialis]
MMPVSYMHVEAMHVAFLVSMEVLTRLHTTVALPRHPEHENPAPAQWTSSDAWHSRGAASVEGRSAGLHHVPIVYTYTEESSAKGKLMLQASVLSALRHMSDAEKLGPSAPTFARMSCPRRLARARPRFQCGVPRWRPP